MNPATPYHSGGSLDPDARRELLRLARVTLFEYLARGAIPAYAPLHRALEARAGAFVSLHRALELRGCIGRIVPDGALFRTVQECAIGAAVDDGRFGCVTIGEVPELAIEISVLEPPRRIAGIEEIEVGRHGLIISRRGLRGLLLPQVASHNGWERETFLAQTCRKAGLPLEAWHDPATTIEVFAAEVFGE